MSQAPAATRALSVLTFLASQPGPVSATRIAEAIGIPRSSTYHLLRAMEDEGFISHLPEERRYGLGLAVHDVGSAYLRQEPIARIGRPLLAHAVERVGENGHLSVLHGRDVIYVVEQRAPKRRALVTDVDVRLPAHLTASGRAMLAALPLAQIRALYSRAEDFVSRTDTGPRSVPALMRVLEQVRRDGYAQENGEVTAGQASVAVACLDRTGHPIAAVAFTFSERRRLDERLIETARRSARELGLRLGTHTN